MIFFFGMMIQNDPNKDPGCSRERKDQPDKHDKKNIQ